MLLLAFDTATPAITVAVHDGTRVIAEAYGEGAMAHGELLAPAIREAMSRAGATMADLTDVAVGVGPGPFTGLRVGVVTALTLGSTLGLTTHGVCSLDVVAADVQVEGEFLVATDARRKEVYWARYGADHVRLDGPHVLKPADLAAQHPDLPAYGRGAHLYDGVLRASGEAGDPRAAVLANLVASGRAVQVPLEPLYLRRPDAVPQASSKRA
ncbi:tRNA (adenosine(37)-N6)-threonylcarbamoyltransferase complex dimerization subunit type 1 TsaB [Aeromicrobium sp. SMF47]|uniref:tRNA (Adenosine(37)-N6)-threonylcarbamoyltransferase complex dimerization subunit type 1 TsaB n=1 Tax=Aeromicrobium yanjiei TaxID=2662028 RepID=A0A5Q2MN27_9ACTN|nr:MULTISPECIES: tRNA (adenosine(37)-N6)-threonylcarbamoyltransferase complex dimerization subunit type 1 TsaB [Aeromicrobium]MRJ76287.1 tRNA (adenosine(37)-N6)-threonylcarbamoyltransferase complex dimerization subunit type 1 TsaB [Aeromicrobium yanjiei]MRK00637.1 tRNA (adenosine(37)-N6)-threonylcarbamoyltransferase complex dimerization subunit type 1 TsaB [Aeromicrobium sp. S22]QGG42532.1 tRNA (adenosine(37)-N6)-threonylcarbamoyltransferase complex dimerization subunit type 1 TsaB [Aeromicrobiu